MKSPNSNSQIPIAKQSPRVAIVADWLTDFGGAERVVLALADAFPGAPIYTSVYEPSPEMKKLFDKYDIRPTFLQKVPRPLRKLHKFFPHVRGLAFRKLDMSEYDIIISSSSAESKQVRKTRDDQVHICYCHTPIRYYWSHYREYKKDPGFGKLNWLIKLAIPVLVPMLRSADKYGADKVDVFIANSTEVQERIKRYYNRSSTVIHPPVDVSRFQPARVRSDYYVVTGRQVPYKRIDLAVAAATELDLPLKVFGNGSEHGRLVEMAGPTVEFHTDRSGDASDDVLEHALNHAKGFIFPSEEDFGIVAIEALAGGTPVIAYNKGGSRDIVDDDCGMTFDEQNVKSVIETISKFREREILPATCQRKAKRFDKSLFTTKIHKVVADAYRNRKQP